MVATSTDNSAADSRDTAALLSQAARTEKKLYLVVLVFFLISTGATIYFNRSMSGGMSMPGNWTMSMMWMTMPGESWFASGFWFIVMWSAMMIAMMLPSTLPMLLLYRRAMAFRGEGHLSRATFLVASGYFFVWALFGAVAYVAALGIAQSAMRSDAFSRLVPLAAGIGLCVAGIYQLTPWKSACLKHCRDPLAIVAHHLQPRWTGALRLGIHHGAFCVACCWGLMLVQLALGVMNLGVMAAIAVIIALEKLFARGELVARLTGVAAILGGVVVAARAVI